MVAHAWADPAFKKRLLEDGKTASTMTTNVGPGRAVCVVELARALGRACGVERVLEDRCDLRVGAMHAC